jgi:ethanolamine transporter EutH
MATIVGTTAAYVAANGHTMTAPLVVGKHAGVGAVGRPVSAWARCVESCPACAAGGNPSDFCGEEW